MTSLKMEDLTSKISYVWSFFQNTIILTLFLHPLFTIFGLLGQAPCFGLCKWADFTLSEKPGLSEIWTQDLLITKSEFYPDTMKGIDTIKDSEKTREWGWTENISRSVMSQVPCSTGWVTGGCIYRKMRSANELWSVEIWELGHKKHFIDTFE